VNLEDTFPGESKVDPVIVGGALLLMLLLTGGLYRLVKRPRHERAEPERISINR
jgi:hypothetical protein